MKILIATYLAYPRVGGVSTYIGGLMQELTKRGHAVDLLAHTPGLDEIYLSGGGRIGKASLRAQVEPTVDHYFVEHWPRASQWIRWRETERLTFETVVGQFNLADYDVIHAQDALAAIAMHRVKPATTPLVVTYHNVKSREWQVSEPAKDPMEMDYIQREEALSAERANAVIFPCQWLHDSFMAFQISIPNPHVIPYGTIVPAHSSTTIQNGCVPIIACPARLVPIKGHFYLFEALRLIRDQGYTFRCWVIGDGPLKTQLMSLRRALGLERMVEFLGARNDVGTLLARSDLIVLPTLHDTFPFVVIEAQLTGKPVVASRVGGISEMIEPAVDGWLVEPRDSTALADIMRRLLETPAERTAVGRQARQRAVNRWSLHRMVSETVRVYCEALMSNRPSPTHRPFPDVDFLSPLADKWNRRGVSFDSYGHVSGHIYTRDHSGLELPMVVHLQDASGVTLQSTLTDRFNDFRFTNLPPGKYALLIKTSNHDSPYSSYVEVNGGEVSADIHLR